MALPPDRNCRITAILDPYGIFVTIKIFDISILYVFIFNIGIMADIVAKSKYVKVRLNNNGRIVIPAEIRHQLGLEPGDTVLLSVEGDMLKLESHRNRILKVQESMRKFIPTGRRLAKALIADRREEAQQEMEEWLG